MSKRAQHHQKLLGGRFVYELKFLMGYQRILDSKGVQTFYGRRNKKNKIFYEGGKWKCGS
jgi:hypothetical protein